MKIIHTADIHLCMDMRHSSLSPEASEEHRKQIWRTFSSLIGEVKEQEADMLIIAGDLFETRCARSSDIKRAADFFREIPDTRVLISCGNHDPLSRTSLYEGIDFPDNVTIFPAEMSRMEFPDLGVNVYGFSWDRERYDSIPFDVPEPDRSEKNILVLHCDVTRRSEYMPVNVKMLAGIGFDYVALGHIHKPGAVRENICYPGSLEPLDFSEDGDHGYILVEEEDGKFIPRFVPFASTRFISSEVDITGITDHSALKEKIRTSVGAGPGDHVRVKLTGMRDPSMDLSFLKDEMEGGYRYLCVVDGTRADYDLIRLYRDNSDNIIGRFILALMNDAATDEKARTALYCGLDALLESGGGKK